MEELNALSEAPDLWDKPEKAQALLQERNRLDAKLGAVRKLDQDLQDTIDLIALAEAEGEAGLVAEGMATLTRLQGDAHTLQMRSLLSGEVDDNDCFLEVNAGAGGTEACDWAEMLLRMYIRWAEQHGYAVQLLSRTDGDGAGIKSATIRVNGAQAYGWLKGENGVHRLVRISPYDSNARRHTSFASVSVSPVIDDRIEIEIAEKDVRTDTYRSGGAGGQHVNKTDSAVRLTHMPTGIVVACQTERSQHSNRAFAWDMLRARLYELELQKREAKNAAAYDDKTEIGWGHQIRSYVLHPYQMVKDLRTEVENTDADAVLDGDLDRFLEATLAHRLGDEEAA